MNKPKNCDLLAIIIALAIGTLTVPLVAQSQQQSGSKTLYQRLGGYDSIAAFVDTAFPRVATDPKLRVAGALAREKAFTTLRWPCRTCGSLIYRACGSLIIRRYPCWRRFTALFSVTALPYGYRHAHYEQVAGACGRGSQAKPDKCRAERTSLLRSESE